MRFRDKMFVRFMELFFVLLSVKKTYDICAFV